MADVKISDQTELAATPDSTDELAINDGGAGKKITVDNLLSYYDARTATMTNKTLTLGGMVDVNGNAIGDGTRELLTFVEDGSAVNHVEIENEATGNGPIIRATGDDATVDLHLATKSWGEIKIDANTDLQDYDLSGVGQLTLSDTSQLTIATGAVTATGPVHTISCETGTSDDLDTINTFIGLLAIRQHTSTDTITVKHGTAANKIQTTDGADLAMTARGYLLLYRKTTSEAWIVVGGAGGGGGGTVTFTDNIMCMMFQMQGTVGYSDVHALATASAKVSGWVMPDGSSDSIINCKVIVPGDLAATPTTKVRVHLMTQASTTGNVRMIVSSGAYADAENMDAALTAESASNETVPASSIEYRHVYTQALTVAGDPTAGDQMIIQIKREKSHASDTFSGDVIITAVELIIDRTIG